MDMDMDMDFPFPLYVVLCTIQYTMDKNGLLLWGLGWAGLAGLVGFCDLRFAICENIGGAAKYPQYMTREHLIIHG